MLCKVKVGKYITLFNDNPENMNIVRAPKGFNSVQAYHEFTEIFVVYKDKVCIPLYIVEITHV
jgi:hypothetical protein